MVSSLFILFKIYVNINYQLQEPSVIVQSHIKTLYNLETIVSMSNNYQYKAIIVLCMFNPDFEKFSSKIYLIRTIFILDELPPFIFSSQK